MQKNKVGLLKTNFKGTLPSRTGKKEVPRNPKI